MLQGVAHVYENTFSPFNKEKFQFYEIEVIVHDIFWGDGSQPVKKGL